MEAENLLRPNKIHFLKIAAPPVLKELTRYPYTSA